MHQSEPVVVIGSGPAGASAAWFLSRAGLRTLVLEAGPAGADLGFTARVRGITVAKRKPPLRARADVLATSDPTAVLFESLAPGGLSNHWACAVPRFSPDDFADAKRGGAPFAWPIGYSDLLPWYEQVEPLLHIAGSTQDAPNLPAGIMRRPTQLGSDWGLVAKLAAAGGRSVIPMPYAYGGDTTLTRSATAFNAFKRLLEPAQSAGRLGVQCASSVQRLEWSRAEKRVVAVICRTPHGESRIPCRAVVLAAGAVNSAQILLESRDVDWPRGIGNEHDLVGRYLHDHPLAKLVVRLGRGLSLSPATYLTRPDLKRSEPLYAAAFMQWGDVRTRAKSLLSIRPGKAKSLGFSIFGTMRPTPDDRVSLLAGAGHGERARLAYALAYPQEAVQVLRHARDELMAILEDAGLEPRVDVFRIEPPGTSVHYGGTCRMHATREHGVVDEKCRIFAARNVAVADSAVFTTGPEKNPVLTAMALAARAGASLAEDLRTGLA
jgi:choline dehydrogenase-like flavoprotein